VLISPITPDFWGIIGLISTIIRFRLLNSRNIIRLLGRLIHVRLEVENNNVFFMGAQLKVKDPEKYNQYTYGAFGR